MCVCVCVCVCVCECLCEERERESECVWGGTHASLGRDIQHVRMWCYAMHTDNEGYAV